MIYEHDLPEDVLDELDSVMTFLGEAFVSNQARPVELSPDGAEGFLHIVRYIKEGLEYAKELMANS